MKTIFLALGFMAVFEALMPLAFPRAWSDMLRRLACVPESVVRKMAFVIALLGLVWIWTIASVL